MSIAFVLQQMLYFSIPLLIVALGGLFSERSGVVNIALEGLMVFGGLTGTLFLKYMGPKLPHQLAFLLALLIAAATGLLVSLLHAFASINMKANQVISGTAINMMAPAVAIFVARMVQGVQQITFTNSYLIREVPVLSSIPFIGPVLFRQAYISTYIGIAMLVLSWVILYKTRFGLRLRACGEHPQAADSVGINVYRMRYTGVMISGALAGLGGLALIVPTSTAFNATVSGYGFLALAVLIFGQWRPLFVGLAALFFGFMKTIASVYTGSAFLSSLNIPADVMKMLPYIATLIVLLLTGRRSQAPRASGVPYDAGGR